MLLVLCLLATVVPVARPAAAEPPDPASAEAQFVAQINALRASKGLQALAVHPALVAVARGWAAQMAAADKISHNPNLAAEVRADWQKLGENVGVGMTVDKLHDAFVASPAHYRNLVDPAFEYIGVGVVIGRDGAIFTAHELMQLRTAAPAVLRPAHPAATMPAREMPARAAQAAPAAPEAAPPPPPAPSAPPAPPAAPARMVLVLEQLRAMESSAGVAA